MLPDQDIAIADGKLLDVIRQVNTFGLSIVTLDIRQESTKHAAAVDAITTYLGLGSYLYVLLVMITCFCFKSRGCGRHHHLLASTCASS